MIRSVLFGIVAGSRAMTPLAVAADAARRRALPEDDRFVRLLGSPLVAAGTVALAAAEMGGDKMKSAPDRIAVPGLVARIATASIAGAAFAPRDARARAATAAALAALGFSWLSWRVRLRAMERGGQTLTGLAEDALVAASAAAVARA